MRKKIILYSYPTFGTFVRKDKDLLSQHYDLLPFFFNGKNKIVSLVSFIKQFFFLLFNIGKSSILITWLGGNQSFLPCLFGKIFGKPSIIILGGTDCVSFPSFNYGNFNKPLLGWCSRMSYRMASHLVPVHESLVISDYTFTNNDFPKQGYLYFCPEVKAPNTIVNTGYDPEKFRPTKGKIPGSFLTVALLNAPNFFRKGIDLVFMMAEKFPDCTFTVIGSSDKMVYPPIPANLRLLPVLPNDELRGYFGSHEFYLQLSLCEGIPNALCEAMLCECVPIGSAVFGIPYAIGDTGFVLEKKDPVMLEKLIKQALDSDKRRLGKMARERIIEKFPMSVREKLFPIIEGLINRA